MYCNITNKAKRQYLNAHIRYDQSIQHMVKFLNIYRCKRHIVTNPALNSPYHFQHISPIFLATFWSSLEVFFHVFGCTVVATPVFWTDSKHVSFIVDSKEEPEVLWRQIRWQRWMRTHRKVFLCTGQHLAAPFAMFCSHPRKTLTNEYFQNCLRKCQE